MFNVCDVIVVLKTAICVVKNIRIYTNSKCNIFHFILHLFMFPTSIYYGIFFETEVLKNLLWMLSNGIVFQCHYLFFQALMLQCYNNIRFFCSWIELREYL